MTALRAWLAREARRQTQRPELLAALVLGHGVAYARYRLGFVLLRLLLRTGLHSVEVLFLSSALPFEYLAPLIGYRALVSIAATLHWGATEGLRQRVRDALHDKHPHAARATVESWLGVGCLLALLPVFWMLARIARAGVVAHASGITLFDAYALACCLRLLFDVGVRTYHAGVFAVRRVYRPLPTLLCADLLEVSIIVLGFERLGAWSIPLAIVGAGGTEAAFGWYYARAAYMRHRMLAPRLSALPTAWRALSRDTWRPALVHALANVSMQLDAVLLLLLVRIDPPRRHALSFAVIYYVLRPLLGLATHWVRSFYFDLSRIEVGALRIWRPRLLRLLGNLAVACALIGAALTLCVAWLLWPKLATTTLLWLVPLFAARAVFALGQLEAFAQRRYRTLLALTLALALGLGLLAVLAQDALQVIGGASALLAAGAFWLRAQAQRTEAAAADRGVLGVAEWLAELRGQGTVCIGVLSISRRSARVARVMQALLAANPGLRVARYARNHLLLMAAADTAPSMTQLVASSAGTLTQAWLSPSCQGVDSIGIARARAVLPTQLHDALCPSTHERRADSLVSEFRRRFPQGSLLDLATGKGALERTKLPRALLGEFVQQVVAASRQSEREQRTRLPLALAVYAPAGQAKWLFVVARATPGFAAFQARVRAASLHASFYPEAGSAHAQRVFGLGPRIDRAAPP